MAIKCTTLCSRPAYVFNLKKDQQENGHVDSRWALATGLRVCYFGFFSLF